MFVNNSFNNMMQTRPDGAVTNYDFDISMFAVFDVKTTNSVLITCPLVTWENAFIDCTNGDLTHVNFQCKLLLIAPCVCY